MSKELQIMNKKNKKQYNNCLLTIDKIRKDTKTLTIEQLSKLEDLSRAVDLAWSNFNGLYSTHKGNVTTWILDPNTNKQMASDFIRFMTADFNENHPGWIIEHDSKTCDPLKDTYTHLWDEGDSIINFNFVLNKFYLFGGINDLHEKTGEIFWDNCDNDTFSKKTIYQFLRDENGSLAGEIHEMYDSKFRPLPLSKIPFELREYVDFGLFDQTWNSSRTRSKSGL